MEYKECIAYIFIALSFFIYWKLPHKFRWLLLLITNAVFYLSFGSWYIVFLIATILVTYFAGIKMESTALSRKTKKAVFVLSVLFPCLLLFVFKYLNFVLGSFYDLINLFDLGLHFSSLKLVMPLGISFYTFQTIGYLSDVYTGKIKAERNLGIFAVFMSFFPQILSGPIPRAGQLLPQIHEEISLDYDRTMYGIKQLFLGIFYKYVVADTLSVYAGNVYSDLHSFSGFTLLLTVFIYSIQIYCDFAGYSMIALGTAKLFGFELIENFKNPYFSTSFKEFWSRWHISLSTWLRDYIYIPLGGNRKGKLRTYLNLLITFLVSGIWHGADWTFVLWGAVHGAVQVFEKITGLSKAPKNKVLAIIKGLLCFTAVSLIWVLFRADSVSDAVYIYSNMFNGIAGTVNYLVSGVKAFGLDTIEFVRNTVFILIPLFVMEVTAVKTDIIKWVSSRKLIIRWAIYISFALLIIYTFPLNAKTEFIYFKF